MKLYTLLYLEEKETSMHNAKVENFKAQINLYIYCILNLQNSLISENITLNVITNNKNLLLQSSYAIKLNIVELDFKLNVPSGINFYAAHYKLEVYKYFSTLDEDYVGLIDNDIVCINEMSFCFKNIIEAKIPVYYDITDQVYPAYGQDRIIKEKQMISHNNRIGLWAGGEFIAGPPQFFDLLYKEVMAIIDRYFLLYKQFHHQSDEFPASVAIENIILLNKATIVDAGRIGIIARYWNSETLHVQKEFIAYKDSFLLHLPSDKAFLAEFGKTNFSSKDFLMSYSNRMVRHKSIYNSLKKSVKSMLLKK